MAKGPRYAVKFKRKRQGKTNYKKRLALLKSGFPRFVVRKSNKYIYVQIIEYDPKGDKTICQAHSAELKKFGWNRSAKSLPAAYLAGLLAGKRALKKGIKKALLDSGLYTLTPNCRIYAALKGAIDAGLNIPHSPKILPDEARLKGEHIAKYLKINNLPKLVESIKEKIEHG